MSSKVFIQYYFIPGFGSFKLLHFYPRVSIFFSNFFSLLDLTESFFCNAT